MQERQAVRRDLAAFHGFTHRAARLAIVPAIAEAAASKQRTDLDERVRDRLRRDVSKAEDFEPR